MKREYILASKKERLLEEKERYTFPEFLRALRFNLAISRRQVVEEIGGISDMRLFYLEHGRFTKKVLSHEIRLLADYYDIDADMLMQKASDFYNEPQDAQSRYLRKVI